MWLQNQGSYHDLPACLARFDNQDINVLGGLDKCGYKYKVRLSILPSKHASYSCNRDLVKRSRRIEVARKDSWSIESKGRRLVY